jgi:hypothetical protein
VGWGNGNSTLTNPKGNMHLVDRAAWCSQCPRSLCLWSFWQKRDIFQMDCHCCFMQWSRRRQINTFLNRALLLFSVTEESDSGNFYFSLCHGVLLLSASSLTFQLEVQTGFMKEYHTNTCENKDDLFLTFHMYLSCFLIYTGHFCESLTQSRWLINWFFTGYSLLWITFF